LAPKVVVKVSDDGLTVGSLAWGSGVVIWLLFDDGDDARAGESAVLRAVTVN
jgi:hypothetical protein